MEMRVATWADVESVLARISDANRAEYEKIGFPGETFNLRLVRFMMAGEAHCLWFDGQPQAFIAVAETAGVTTTWLGATQACFDAGIGPIRVGRKHMRAVADRRGPVTSFVTAGHPRIVKWMRLLGFDQIGEMHGAKVFRYR